MCNITRWDKKISSEDLIEEIESSEKFAKVMASIALAERYAADPSSMPPHASMDTNKAYQAVSDVQHLDKKIVTELAYNFVNHKVGNNTLSDLDEYANELSLEAIGLTNEDIEKDDSTEYEDTEDPESYLHEEDYFE